MSKKQVDCKKWWGKFLVWWKPERFECKPDGPDPLPDPPDPEDPGPVPEPQPDPEPTPGQGSNAFLWKPASDNDGRLVVLLPAWVIDPANPGGSPGTLIVMAERGVFRSYANGNRAHYRFSKPGAAYGRDVLVTLHRPVPAGPLQISVPNGAVRYEVSILKP